MTKNINITRDASKPFSAFQTAQGILEKIDQPGKNDAIEITLSGFSNEEAEAVHRVLDDAFFIFLSAIKEIQPTAPEQIKPPESYNRNITILQGDKFSRITIPRAGKALASAAMLPSLKRLHEVIIEPNRTVVTQEEGLEKGYYIFPLPSDVPMKYRCFLLLAALAEAHSAGGELPVMFTDTNELVLHPDAYQALKERETLISSHQDRAPKSKLPGSRGGHFGNLGGQGDGGINPFPH
jgi:hypothetical protein